MSLIAGFEHIARENEPLAPYTQLNLGGSAEYFAEPTNQEELVALVVRFSNEQKPIRLIGGGSNVIVREEGVQGLVLHLAAPEFCGLTVSGNTMRAGGGTRLSHFVSTAVREGLAGPEQLVGLPGTVGGALHNNSGAQGKDIGAWVKSARVLTRSGEFIDHSEETLTFSYRQSSLDELVILSATFEFENESSEVLTKQMQKLWIVRRAEQPVTQTHSIFVFKDHGGERASDLIERAGLKGFSVGEAEIADTDANLIVTKPGATVGQVTELIQLVKDKVFDTLAIELDEAINIW